MRVRAPSNMTMDSEDPQLADEYVQEFVLDHFEDVNVKREASNNNDQDTVNQNLPPLIRLPSIQSIPTSGNGGHIQSPPHHILTPPGSGSGIHPQEFQNNMIHAGVVMRGVMYPGTPGTPPDTPPGSNSPPHHHSYHPMDHPHVQHHHPLPNRPQNFNDEMIWVPPNPLRQEPLDLRPHCAEDWSLLQHHGGKFLRHDEPRPMSVSSCSVMSPSNCYSDDTFNDDLLISISVRDLNKRLHGFPKDQIGKIKAKRRTLKNRGYAQNCRSKRLHQRQELEVTNKHLQQELHRIKTEYNRILEERNHYKKKYNEIFIRSKVDCGLPNGDHHDPAYL